MLALLTKELIEQANRRRTYWLRLVVAGGLILTFLMVYRDAVSSYEYDDTLGLLGRGQVIFDSLVYGCLWASLALVPGMTAAALTDEKESGTLPLLMLSRIGLRGIVLQKWLARVVTGGSLLLPALPLGAVAYACGGLELQVLVFGLALVAVTLMWTAALALAASAWCRSTMGAFILAYGLVGGLCLLAFTGNLWGLDHHAWLCPPGLYLIVHERLGGGLNGLGLLAVLQALFPLIVCASSALLFAVLVVRRRAEVHARPFILRLFAALDRSAVAVDARWFKRSTQADLPRTRPVRWREVQGRSLANWRYLIRWSLPLLIVVLGIMIAGGNRISQTAGVMTCVVMAIAMLVIAVKAAGAFSGERADQTLPVLLTTPLRPRDILRDKLAGLRRLHLACGGLIAVILAIRLVIDGEFLPDLQLGNDWHREWFGPLSVAAAILIPAITAWMAVLMGLIIHRRSYAVMAALGVVVMINIGLPMLLMILVWLVSDDHPDALGLWLLGTSPGLLPMINEVSGLRWNDTHEGGKAVFLWCVFQSLQYLALRWYCLHTAERWLRRRV
jgi:ABC-type transport system involved in multi-copper enzyme maturation permease subunit